MITSIRSLALFLAAFSAIVSFGCATTASAKPLSRKVGERVTGGVVDEALTSLDTPENRRHLGNVVGSPELTRAVHDLSSSVAEGVVDGVMKAASDETNALAAGLGPSLESNMDDHVTPAVRRMTSQVVRTAVSASFKGLAKGIDEDLGPVLATTLERDLGPAMAIVIQRDIMPAVARGLAKPEVQEAVGDTSSQVAGKAIRGSEEAVQEMREEKAENGEDSTLEILGAKVAVGLGIAVLVATLFAILFIGAVIALRRTRRRITDMEMNSRHTERLVEHLALVLERGRQNEAQA